MKGLADPTLARRLSEGRRNAGLTLEDEACAVGVSKGTIWQYENGRVHVPADRLTDIAHAIGCHVSDFHKPPGSPFPKPQIQFRPPRGGSNGTPKPPRNSSNGARSPAVYINELRAELQTTHNLLVDLAALMKSLSRSAR